MRSIGDVSIDTSNIANNRGRQTVVIVAVLGLLAAYIHAELYTVYGPFIKVRDWGVPPTWALVVQNMRWFFRGIAVVSLITLEIAESRSTILSHMIR